MNNQTVFQFFHWYYSKDTPLWINVGKEAVKLSSLGITQVWLPPAYKSAKGDDEPGYAVYDLYDLGEFDQKGSVKTKYGTKDEYLFAIEMLHAQNIQVLADIVLNHKHGGDEIEQVQVQVVDEDERNETVGGMHTVNSHTRFNFSGRNNKYSDFKWDWKSFSGIKKFDKVNRIVSEFTDGQWDEIVGDEKGNYDYLMGNDIEFRNPAVKSELIKWGNWYIDTTHIDGFRLDGLKHISPSFYNEWLDAQRLYLKKEMPCIGEFWKSDVDVLLKYIDATQERIKLFDVPLHFNFHQASQKGSDYDLRTIFDKTLTSCKPNLAVTFVENHDTQPFQALESSIAKWFRPLANALILLRPQGLPCVFHPELYGASYSETKDGLKKTAVIEKVPCIENLLYIRKQFAYGKQTDYFDSANLIGWTMEGVIDKENSGIAVLINNKSEALKKMQLGSQNAGKIFVDWCGGRTEKVLLNETGEGEFFVSAGSLSVWVNETAEFN